MSTPLSWFISWGHVGHLKFCDVFPRVILVKLCFEITWPHFKSIGLFDPLGFPISLLTGHINTLWNVKSVPRSTSQAISFELKFWTPLLEFPIPVCFPSPKALWAVISFGRLYADATLAIKSGFDWEILWTWQYRLLMSESREVHNDSVWEGSKRSNVEPILSSDELIWLAYGIKASAPIIF